MNHIIRFFPHDMAPALVGSMMVDGVRYVPFISVCITPELAAQRRAINAQSSGTWSPSACKAQLIVTYRPERSPAVSALGRL